MVQAVELEAYSVTRLASCALDHPTISCMDLRINTVTANTRDFIQDRIAQATLAHSEEQATKRFTGRRSDNVVFRTQMLIYNPGRRES